MQQSQLEKSATATATVAARKISKMQTKFLIVFVLLVVTMFVGQSSADDLEKKFVNLDKDNDGFLSRAELPGAINAKGLKVDEVIDQILSTADTNKDGKLSLEEIRAAHMTLS